MPSLDKFDGTTCPKTHLKMYVGAMNPLGVENELLAQLFQQSLTGAAMRWFVDLDANQKRTWDDICNAFVKQYHYNVEVDVTRRDLETTKQLAKESFSTFLTRWRTKAAQMVNRPTEQEQVDIIVKNLLPTYQTHLLTQYLPDFKALIFTASKIEDLIQTGQIKEESFSSRFKKSTPYQYDVTTSTSQIGGEVASISHHQPLRLERRNFTDLGVPLTVVYKKALEAEIIKPLEPRAPPNPLPKNYNSNEYCEYHQGAGHKTDACKTLKHKIQDLIDSRDIIPPKPKTSL